MGESGRRCGTVMLGFFFSSRRRHTRFDCDWSSDVCSSDLNRPLAEEMAHHLGQPLCAVTIRRFADGEIFVKIDENVRGRDVFIIQPTNPPAENLMELLLLIDAARRASAARITAVLPYFGYARQD